MGIGGQDVDVLLEETLVSPAEEDLKGAAFFGMNVPVEAALEKSEVK